MKGCDLKLQNLANFSKKGGQAARMILREDWNNQYPHCLQGVSKANFSCPGRTQKLQGKVSSCSQYILQNWFPIQASSRQ